MSWEDTSTIRVFANDITFEVATAGAG